MGKASRDKGKRGEREVVNLFKSAGFEARRPAGQSFRGSDAADVQLPGLPELWVEVKRGKKTNIRAALKQATEAIGTRGCWPIAITRDDHEPEAIVSLPFGAFSKLLKLAYPGVDVLSEAERVAGGGVSGVPDPRGESHPSFDDLGWVK